MTTKLRKLTFVKDGLTLHAEISGCVFGYPNYPLQVGVRVKENDVNYNTAFMVDRTVNGTTYTNDHLRKLVYSVQIRCCEQCGDRHPFGPDDKGTNWKCWKCESVPLLAAIQKEQEREERKINAKFAKQGCKFRVDAWVHPAHGDDYQMSFGFKVKPADAEIQALLRKRGSQILTDFAVRGL